MNGETLEIVRPGALTSVQDLGRPHYRKFGVTSGGAMDCLAASAANILAGNTVNEAVLEITLLGPAIVFRHDCIAALAGADLDARIDDERLEPWTSFSVRARQTLSFYGRRAGARAYLAVRAGIDVPIVLGSRGTDMGTGFGGYFGRALRAGDVLRVRPYNLSTFPNGKRLLAASDLSELRPDGMPIRFLRSGAATDAGVERFTETAFIVQPESDRMGCRLESAGAPLSVENEDIRLSAPVVAGAIQTPPSGQPIVLTADCQTVGGYPVIGTVITVDLGRLVQIAPGEQVSFIETNLLEAQELLAAQMRYLRWIAVSNCR